ncbi:MAG: hypothetical protein KDI71_01090 [Xanthomonadales bacterium]|nr:hypothetical protein [Xanthomonadales bacterium]
MSANPEGLTVVSNLNTQFFFTQMAIGKTVLNQQPTQSGYWFVVLDRRNLSVVYNQFQTANDVAPNIGNYNTSDYLLIVATTGVGLNRQPQGPLFKFLDLNGAGRELRRIDQVAVQLNCGSLGTFGYALVGVLGDMNMPGFEASQITNPNTGPILTIQLVPVDVNGTNYYTPVALSNT